MMKRPITIAYITVDDPRDRRTWSGTNHFLLRALEEQVEHVVTFGPLRPQPLLLLLRITNQVLWRIFRRRYNYRDSVWLSKAYAKHIEPRLGKVDLIVAPAGLATTANLRSRIPIVHINDRCLAGAVGYHRILQDLAAFSLREGLALERQGIGSAALTVYSSHWAGDAAKRAVPEAVDRIAVIPFGANLDEAPPAPDRRAGPPLQVKMLLIAVNWEDKGGPIAYETLLALKRSGVSVQLVVCGCEPPSELDDTDLVREGFLNKNDPEQRARLEAHFRTADLLILPTRFEAYGIVLCEAAAHGLPVLATRTGGIPTIVKEGSTGFLFALEDGGEAYAARILELVRDPERWATMRLAARERYESILNWQRFTQTLLQKCEAAGLIERSR